jgi:hypothetical protein
MHPPCGGSVAGSRGTRFESGLGAATHVAPPGITRDQESAAACAPPRLALGTVPYVARPARWTRPRCGQPTSRRRRRQALDKRHSRRRHNSGLRLKLGIQGGSSALTRCHRGVKRARSRTVRCDDELLVTVRRDARKVALIVRDGCPHGRITVLPTPMACREYDQARALGHPGPPGAARTISAAGRRPDVSRRPVMPRHRRRGGRPSPPRHWQ